MQEADMHDDGVGQIKVEDALEALRAALEEGERDRPASATIKAAEPAPRAYPTMDELVARMIAERDQAHRKAADARAELERLAAARSLDEAARAWRKATKGAGLQ
jgi:hypothetical protein